MRKLLLILLCLPLLFTTCKKDDHSPGNSNWNPNNTGSDTTNTGSDTTNIFVTAQISLDVSGLENLDGDLAIVMNNSSEQFISNTEWYKDTTVDVNSDNMIILIKDIIAGTYAVSLFHDQNSNGELDLNFFNIPEEGFGFSNNPTILFSQPDFNDCKFIIEAGDSVFIPITLVYL